MTKVLLGFLLGIGVGAAAALLYAPATGQDLRGQLHTQADADYQRLRAELQKGMGEMHSRLDQIQANLPDSAGKLGREEAEEAA